MLDFTSALYLGLRHDSRSLRSWSELTTGRPAALAAPRGASELARKLAELQGCERGALAPSTLHLFWDLFGQWKRGSAIYLDSAAYPIGRWGVERAKARGIPVRSFQRHDVDELRDRVEREPWLTPIVVADGYCQGCGGAAPIAGYLEVVRAFRGTLVLDDTQALGILGHSPSPDAPYGWGGGGTLRYCRIRSPEVMTINSLAKGFGVPMAVLAGSAERIAAFEELSETRVHCSPPSSAAIAAAERALEINASVGDRLRLRLAGLVSRLRAGAMRVGLQVGNGLFPAQALVPSGSPGPAELYRGLLERGVRTVLHRDREGPGQRVSLLVTAAHTTADIDTAVEAMAAVVNEFEMKEGNRHAHTFR